MSFETFFELYAQNKAFILSLFVLSWLILLYKYFSHRRTIKQLKSEQNIYHSMRKFVPEVLLHVLNWTRENEFTIVPLVDEDIIQLRKEKSHVYCEILRPNVLKVYKFHDQTPVRVTFDAIDELPGLLQSHILSDELDSIVPEKRSTLTE